MDYQDWQSSREEGAWIIKISFVYSLCTVHSIFMYCVCMYAPVLCTYVTVAQDFVGPCSHNEICIHGLGVAINRAINLALQLKETSSFPMEVCVCVCVCVCVYGWVGRCTCTMCFLYMCSCLC